jgi:hypothetical protein
MKLRVERTGKQYSIASNEFLVTFPDGTTQTIWSPPWNDFTKEEENRMAYNYARKLWEDNNQDSDDIDDYTLGSISDWANVE